MSEASDAVQPLVPIDAIGSGRARAAENAPVGSAGAFPVLSARELSCGYGAHAVLSNVSFDLAAGQALVLLGPNGVGKTTLFKTLLGFLRPLGGSVDIQGRDTTAWTRREFAREVAYIPQLHTPSFSFSVHDVVLMGRTPHLSGLSAPSRGDEAVAEAAIERMGIAHLGRRDYASLSGGERQMVLIARALAQEPRILVMDEPCASLDFGNQARLLDQVLDLAGQGMAIVMTTHDPNHAFLLDGDVLCLGRGGTTTQGRACEVLTAERMSRLYSVPVAIDEVRGPAGDDGRCPTSLSCVPLVGGKRKTGGSR